tara:strand:- start:2202 stop:2435 length:234 start_codon:yes stop_codon:yes gene_type:complete
MNIKSTLLREDATILDGLNVINNNEALVAFVIDENDKLLGTITDGDLRRAFLKGFKNNDYLRDVMKKDFKYLNNGST